MALGGELLAQLFEIVDDAVMHHGDPPGAVDVGMGIDHGRHAVGGPAGMPDAGHAFALGQRPRQGLDADGVLEDLDAVPGDGDAAGIVAAVLQLAQAVEEYRLGAFPTDIPDDAAHDG